MKIKTIRAAPDLWLVPYALVLVEGSRGGENKFRIEINGDLKCCGAFVVLSNEKSAIKISAEGKKFN